QAATRRSLARDAPPGAPPGGGACVFVGVGGGGGGGGRPRRIIRLGRCSRRGGRRARRMLVKIYLAFVGPVALDIHDDAVVGDRRRDQPLGGTAVNTKIRRGCTSIRIDSRCRVQIPDLTRGIYDDDMSCSWILYAGAAIARATRSRHPASKWRYSYSRHHTRRGHIVHATSSARD